MISLKVPMLKNCTGKYDLLDISKEIDLLTEIYRIDKVNWPDFSYKPSVKFRIAYGKRELFLKYYVEEEAIRAEKSLNNDMVCEDSCVEFFVSPAADGVYYNFEFNCIGTCRVGFGTSRADNSVIDLETVDKIRRYSTLGNKPFHERKGSFKWELIAVIPLGIFERYKITTLQGMVFRANFYKCGDKLSLPHYLTWNEVGTPEPDFHSSDFFGEIQFY